MQESSQRKEVTSELNVPVFSEIENSNSLYFDSAIKIYFNSFPPNERHSKKVIEERLNSGKSRLFVGLIQGEVVLMSLLFNLPDSTFILLDYMAVSSKFRGKNIGSKFISYLSHMFKETNKYLIMEVENPVYGDNKNERIKRIEFYKKNGAKLLTGVQYVLPPLDGKTTTEMSLMILPEYRNGKIGGAEVRELIIKIYKYVYNREYDDALLNSFINKISETIILT